MLDPVPEKTATTTPKTDKKVLTPQQVKVQRQKDEALRSGNWSWWPSKRQQNGWD